ncbi:MAG: stage III sporulation protein AB [Clostridia bacterium]|nr:stage III sporulation protein AB [Clostridia bacterium]
MRMTGILLLALVPTILSFRLGEEIRRKEKLRNAFCDFLCHIHFQINNFLRDQEEIYSRFDNAFFRETDFFLELENRLSENSCGAFGFAWERHSEDFSFDRETGEILDRLAKNFGLLEKETQLAQLSEAISLLKQKKAEHQSECNNKIKILRISGLTAGLGILILLI